MFLQPSFPPRSPLLITVTQLHHLQVVALSRAAITKIDGTSSSSPASVHAKGLQKHMPRLSFCPRSMSSLRFHGSVRLRAGRRGSSSGSWMQLTCDASSCTCFIVGFITAVGNIHYLIDLAAGGLSLSRGACGDCCFGAVHDNCVCRYHRRCRERTWYWRFWRWHVKIRGRR